MSEFVSTNGASELCRENGSNPLQQLSKGLSDVTPDGTMDRQGEATVLEEYRFVPYVEQSEPTISDCLKQYASDCFNYTLKYLEEWIMRDEHNYVPNKEILIDVLAGQRARGNTCIEASYSGPDCGLAKSLQKLFSLPLSSDMDQKVNNFLNGGKDIFYTDQLLSSLHRVEVLKPCVDIVKENTNEQTVQILEVGGVQNALHNRIMAIADSFPSKPVVYKVATPESLENVLLNGNSQIEINSSPQAQPVDLLILNQILHKQENIDTALNAYSKLSKPGGFLLVKEITGNFPLCLIFEALSETKEFPRNRTSRIFGRYLLDKDWSNFFSSHGLDVIYKRSDGVLSTLYLLRKRIEQAASHTVVFQIKELHFPWLEDLTAKMRKVEMAQGVSDRLWLVSMKETNGLVGLLNCLRREGGGDKVRGIFVTNLKPTSQTPQLSPAREEFQWLLQRDLVQNVFRDGAWGSFRHVPIHSDLLNSSPNRARCDPDKSYVIIVGTDNQEEQDLGEKLVQWLSDRGASKILLCNRYNNKRDTAHTTSLANSWQAQGVQVVVSQRDVTTVDGSWGLVNQAQTLAPLGGVFYLHWTARYGLFQKQTRESFQEVYDLKVQATVNLDHVTRSLCRESLEWFVIFSCSNAGRGRAGHSNSGFASSVVERICEKRQADKLPGLAIQLDDARNKSNDHSRKHSPSRSVSSKEIGDHPQHISNCLVVLDALLLQRSCAVVSCPILDICK